MTTEFLLPSISKWALFHDVWNISDKIPKICHPKPAFIVHDLWASLDTVDNSLLLETLSLCSLGDKPLLILLWPHKPLFYLLCWFLHVPSPLRGRGLQGSSPGNSCQFIPSPQVNSSGLLALETISALRTVPFCLKPRLVLRTTFLYLTADFTSSLGGFTVASKSAKPILKFRFHDSHLLPGRPTITTP